MITMKGQTVHLPKQAWRLGLFFIGILLAGGVLLMYIPAWACPMKRSLCWSPSSAPSCSRSCLGITSSKKRRWPSSTWIIPSTAMNSSRKWMRRLISTSTRSFTVLSTPRPYFTATVLLPSSISPRTWKRTATVMRQARSASFMTIPASPRMRTSWKPSILS